MELDIREVEEICKDLYVRALKILPPDIKAGFQRLQRDETNATGQTILGTMVENIAVAERTNNILCQDTGIPIYNVVIGRDVDFDGAELKRAVRTGCERATKEFSLRSSVVHPITRKNNQTSSGIRVPIIHVDFDEEPETVAIEMIPKGSGSENGSFLQMLLPSEGINAVKRFVIDRVVELGGRVCPPTIVGVGIGGTSDLCMHLAKIAATRPLRSVCSDEEGAKVEAELSRAVNRTRHRAAGARRPLDELRRPCRGRRDPHHPEPGRGEYPVPFGPARQGDHHARRHRLFMNRGPVAPLPVFTGRGRAGKGAVRVRGGPRRDVVFRHPSSGRTDVRLDFSPQAGRRAHVVFDEEVTITHHTLEMPITSDQARALKVGDTVTLERTLYGIRDATLIHMFDRDRETRLDLDGHAVIHTAPNVHRVEVSPEAPVGYTPFCIGTTTSQRMERFTRPLMEREGVRIIIGKGGMAQGTLDAFADLGGAYLAIVGGAAALETTWIEQIEDVDMDESPSREFVEVPHPRFRAASGRHGFAWRIAVRGRSERRRKPPRCRAGEHRGARVMDGTLRQRHADPPPAGGGVSRAAPDGRGVLRGRGGLTTLRSRFARVGPPLQGRDQAAPSGCGFPSSGSGSRATLQ